VSLELKQLDLGNQDEVQFLYDTRAHPDIVRFLFGKPPSSLEEHKAWLAANIPSGSRLIYLARLEGKLVGYCQATCEIPIEVGFVVHPDWQGKGIGGKMVDWLIMEMRRIFPCRGIMLKVKADNVRACKLYEKHGFFCTSKSASDVLTYVLNVLKEIGILGAGRFAHEIALYAARLGYKAVHFFDGTVAGAQIVQGLPYCMGVGSPKVKNLILEQSGCKDFVSIYDPEAIYGDDVQIGKGCVICPGVVLTINIQLGDFVTLNQHCTIGHDCILGDLTNVAPGANLSGNVTIGKACDIGTNAAVREKLSICDDVTLGLNCGVVSSISDSGTYIGTPARMSK